MTAWLLAAALAAEPGHNTRLVFTSDTAAEARPDLEGDPGIRVAERLGMQAYWGKWHAGLDGGVRWRGASFEPTADIDIWRLQLRYNDRTYKMSAGRFARVDDRGFSHLDGGQFGYDAGKFITVDVWGGRLWTPETFEQPDTFLVGTSVGFRPVVQGGRARDHTRLHIGYEARFFEQKPEHRVWLSGSTRNMVGNGGNFLVELREDDGIDVRSRFEGHVYVAKNGQFGGKLAWEGFTNDVMPTGEISPFEWLTPQGYGLAFLNTRWTLGNWTLFVEAGGNTRIEDSGNYWGGTARVRADVKLNQLNFSLYGHGTGMTAGGVYGGGVAVSQNARRVFWGVDAAMWGLKSLDSRWSMVWEARGDLGVSLIGHTPGKNLDLVFNAATGANRLWAAYVRGGVSLRAYVGPRRAR